MPTLRWYQVFISHAWKYDEYHRIKEFLDETPNFKLRDLSVPYDNPLDVKGESELEERLKQQIRHAQVVLIPAGMEVSRSYWVQFEIDFATDLEKPIVGIIPRDKQRIPKIVNDASCEIVGWNRNSIVTAIRQIAL
jgi:hypothetical protein